MAGSTSVRNLERDRLAGGDEAKRVAAHIDVRELLGDLLLELKRPKEGYAEYLAALKQYPNRFRGLYGAARAAEASGDAINAAAYYRRVIELAAHADSVRPEVQRAQAYLSK